jgi:hypothetical protein
MMTGRTNTPSPAAHRGPTIRIVRAPYADRIHRRPTLLKDILNATFTLLPEYENGRSAVLAAIGRPDDAVEDFDAFTELRKPVWRQR